MPTKKTGRPAQFDRAAVLDLAEEFFAERGFEGTTVRELAAGVKCNLALISYHFGGKDGLYDEVLFRHFGEVKKRLKDQDEDENDFQAIADWPEFKDRDIARFSQRLHVFAKTALASTRMQKIICREMMSGGKSMMAAITKAEGGAVGLLQDELSVLKRKKKVRANLDVRLTAISLVGPVVYSCVAAPLLKKIYGFDKLEGAYSRDLVLQLIRGIIP